MRTAFYGDFDGDMSVPETARSLLDVASLRDWPCFSIVTAAQPPTTNHMYVQTGYNRRALSTETVQFRRLVADAVDGRVWKPKGAVMAMVFLLSPFWLTKKHTIRENDVDNRSKTLLDAIKHATGVPDETNWSLHLWKIPTKERVGTHVYLFDQGDVVEIYE